MLLSSPLILTIIAPSASSAITSTLASTIEQSILKRLDISDITGSSTLFLNVNLYSFSLLFVFTTLLPDAISLSTLEREEVEETNFFVIGALGDEKTSYTLPS